MSTAPEWHKVPRLLENQAAGEILPEGGALDRSTKRLAVPTHDSVATLNALGGRQRQQHLSIPSSAVGVVPRAGFLRGLAEVRRVLAAGGELRTMERVGANRTGRLGSTIGST